MQGRKSVAKAPCLSNPTTLRLPGFRAPVQHQSRKFPGSFPELQLCGGDELTGGDGSTKASSNMQCLQRLSKDIDLTTLGRLLDGRIYGVKPIIQKVLIRSSVGCGHVHSAKANKLRQARVNRCGPPSTWNGGRCGITF